MLTHIGDVIPMKERQAVADALESSTASWDTGSCIRLIYAIQSIRKCKYDTTCHRRLWEQTMAPSKYPRTVFWLETDDDFRSKDYRSFAGKQRLKRIREWRKTATSFYIHMLRDKDIVLKVPAKRGH
jgi:hypothetical protein